MLHRELKRIEQLGSRGAGLNPDEVGELDVLRIKLMENGGIKYANTGSVVAANYGWIYAEYERLVAESQLERDSGTEDGLYGLCLSVIEDHVGRHSSKDLLKADERGYFRALSSYLKSMGIPTDVQFNKSSYNFNSEPTNGRWMLLRGKLKSSIAEYLREAISFRKPSVGAKVEDRVEPLFNKILVQLNEEIDQEGLSTAEKIKVFDKLSTLLADMKGERSPLPGALVTHNNVFNVILENKKDAAQLRSKAIELLAGDGYDLV